MATNFPQIEAIGNSCQQEDSAKDKQHDEPPFHDFFVWKHPKFEGKQVTKSLEKGVERIWIIGDQ